MKTPRWLPRFGQWLLTQATWRTVVRLTGLGGMMYLVIERQHPDAAALVAMASMIGLATFASLVPEKDKGK